MLVEELLIKTNEKSKAIKFLELLSGRRHRVSTAFNLYCKDKINSLRVVTSVVKMKRLTENEINLTLKQMNGKEKLEHMAFKDLQKNLFSSFLVHILILLDYL